MSSNQTSTNQTQQSSNTATTTTVQSTCPYHAQVLSMDNNTKPKNLTPIDRYLAEGPTEESAIFVRPDTGKLSTEKGCTCVATATEGQ